MRVRKGKRIPASGSVHVRRHPKGISRRETQKLSVPHRRMREATDLGADSGVHGEETNAPDEPVGPLEEPTIAVKEGR